MFTAHKPAVEQHTPPHNVYITQYFDWNQPQSWKVSLVNKLLRWLGYTARLVPYQATGHMTTVEQRINLYHLLNQVLQQEVPGAIIELGTHTGTTAALLQRIVQDVAPARDLHVFDAFAPTGPEPLLDNFRQLELPLPVVHQGWIERMLPQELPEQICFAHIDVGPSKSPEHMGKTVWRCLEALYPRLTPGAICVLADYCDPKIYERAGFRFPQCILHTDYWFAYPLVRHVADAFLRSKPEKVCILYGGEYSHGYFRKV